MHVSLKLYQCGTAYLGFATETHGFATKVTFGLSWLEVWGC